MTNGFPDDDPYYLRATISMHSKSEREKAVTKYLRREESKQGVTAAVLFFQHLAEDAEKWESDASSSKLIGRHPFFLSAYYRQFADLLYHAGGITRDDIDHVIYGHKKEGG